MRLATPGDPYVCPVCDTTGPPGHQCPKHDLFLCCPRAVARKPRPRLLGHFLAEKYAVLGVLGSGGMANVYWAIEHPSGGIVALKVLRPDLTESLAAEQRFLREAALISEIDNPRLIKCFEYGIDEHFAFMAMEVLIGLPLHAFMAQRDISIVEKTAIGAQLLEGVAAIHTAGLMHRDLKPANIMLCDVGHNQACVKIIDFGLARTLDRKGGPALTGAGDVLGTARYMCPDHVKGSREVGPSSDVYSIGVILYELLAGHTPFDANNPVDMVRLHMLEPVPPLAEQAPDCPPLLASFVHGCLAKTRDERFKDGAEALSAYWRLELDDEGPIRFRTDEAGPFVEQRDPTIALSDSDLIFEELPEDNSILLRLE